MTKENLLYAGVAVGVLLVIVAMIYGVLLPLNRAQSYIGAISSVSSVRTTEEFRDKFRPVLEHPSPIGDEEIPKFFSNDVLGIISQNKDEEVRRDLVDFIEPYMLKDNPRHLLALYQMYALLWQDHQKTSDFEKAEKYLLEAKSIGPKLPPVLYSLFNLYRAKGDGAKMKEIGEEILRYWPEDEGVRSLIQ